MIMIHAVIFDMDGVMIGSEPIQSLAFEKIIRRYGKNPVFDENGIIQTIGMGAKDNWKILKEKHDIDEDIEVLYGLRNEVYPDLLKNALVPKDGLLSLLGMLKARKLPMAVASSSQQSHIELVLKGLGISEYFSAMVSGHKIGRGKPHPDVFLKAAAMLKAPPMDCVVVEDTQVGVEAGKSAGMKVIAVPNRFTARHDFSKADLTLPSLKEITWDILSSL